MELLGCLYSRNTMEWAFSWNSDETGEMVASLTGVRRLTGNEKREQIHVIRSF